MTSHITTVQKGSEIALEAKTEHGMKPILANGSGFVAALEESKAAAPRESLRYLIEGVAGAPNDTEMFVPKHLQNASFVRRHIVPLPITMTVEELQLALQVHYDETVAALQFLINVRPAVLKRAEKQKVKQPRAKKAARVVVGKPKKQRKARHVRAGPPLPPTTTPVEVVSGGLPMSVMDMDLSIDHL
jgi:hypothetical protein